VAIAKAKEASAPGSSNHAIIAKGYKTRPTKPKVFLRLHGLRPGAARRAYDQREKPKMNSRIAGMIAAASTLSAFTITASADCSEPNGRVRNLNPVANDVLCGTGVLNPGDRWQQYHNPNGTLTEYARGADPIDPTRDVGSWTVNDNDSESATITYTYDGGFSYTYWVNAEGSGVFSMCRISDNALVAVVSRQIDTGAPVQCTSFPSIP
jgi:hypothetical protein